MNSMRLFHSSLFKQCAYRKHPCQVLRLRRTQVQTVRAFKRNFGKEENSPSTLGLIGKPFLFMIGGCTLAFTTATIWQYEVLRTRAKQMGKGMIGYQERVFKLGALRTSINTWWNNLSPGKKSVAVIIGLNTAVFALWRLPIVNIATMQRYFTSSPFSGVPCLSMLLSTFSHQSGLHLFVNMYVLWSFGGVASAMFGREQFIATYISAGLFSAFTSHLLKVATQRTVVSLGASGAIIGILGAVCSSYPESRLSIALIDNIIPHSFSAEQGMIGLIVFDTLGILLRWQLFDHAAHLGGMLFGIWYVKYGNRLIWGNREPLMKAWHEIRGTKT